MSLVKPVRLIAVTIFITALMLGCSSGGGGNDDSNDGSQSGGDENTGDGSGGGITGTTRWAVQAPIIQDGCGFRIAAVTQTFTVTGDGSAITVDDGLVSLTGSETSDGFTTGFDETNGSCTRHYEAHFSNVTGATASVALSSLSTCDGAPCENKWAGSAIKVN